MEYQKALREKVNELLSKGKNVVIVGGSGLYIRAALYDYEFKDEEPFDTSVFDKMSNEELHKKLEEIDPEDAKKIHPNNRKRLIRALSIYESQNKTKSEILADQKHEPIYKDVRFFVRDMDREELYSRINTRVDKMMELGLENEVKSLYEKYGEHIQCMQAIGYKELIPYFKGETSRLDAVELIKKNTRNYAKRQMTFIRHQFPVIFYKDDTELLEAIKNG